MKAPLRLDAKEMKQGLKSLGIKTLRCIQGKGSIKAGVLVVVHPDDVQATLSFFKEKGVVSVMGKPHMLPYKTKRYAEFSPAYMGREMFNKISKESRGNS